MRHPEGDKIIIARNDASGDWVYFSVRDDRDNGTIIDFLQWRGGGSLGDIRKTLRAWSGDGIAPAAFVRDLLPISRDRAAVLASWERAKPCAHSSYLTGRGLGPDVLALPIFAGCCRVDPRGNVLFPHFDRSGLCGYEIKNQGFTGFAAGGLKGLWYSAMPGPVKSLVLTESAIDAMSYHVMHGDEAARYMSTGGALNPQQPALLRGAMEKLSAGAVVVLAFDYDDGGEKLADEVRAVAPSSVEIRRVLPPVGCGKDWNEALKLARGLSLVEGAPRPGSLPDPGPYGTKPPRCSGGAIVRRGKRLRVK
jgi:hypothetical protein